jgi:hypothetical protein
LVSGGRLSSGLRRRQRQNSADVVTGTRCRFSRGHRTAFPFFIS